MKRKAVTFFPAAASQQRWYVTTFLFAAGTSIIYSQSKSFL
jgi:hypothetical protein